MQTIVGCGVCNGMGEKPIEKCEACAGKGRILIDNHEFTVHIEKNSRDGRLSHA